MRKCVLMMLLVLSLTLPVKALEIEAPEVPEAGLKLMPENTESFSEGLWELLQTVLQGLRPDLGEAAQVSVSLVAGAMVVSLLRTFSGSVQKAAVLAGAAAVAGVLFTSANSMIRLGGDTISQISEYGKLLLPVLTAALAAQGGVTASAALYAGTAAFDLLLSSILSSLLLPLVYLFLALATANAATGEEVLKKLRDMVKGIISWCLKIVLTVFTTYISITGVVSGTTDAAALKATKVTISSVVPVVGGILSDASEAVLVSAGLMKNAAGIYGILAVLALFLEPFLRIGAHYLVLKATAALCSVFAPKEMTGLMEDFAAAMGLMLAMTGSACLLLLISTVCFMKGVG